MGAKFKLTVVGPTPSAPFKSQESDPFLSTSLERVTHVAQVVTSTCDFPDLSIQNSGGCPIRLDFTVIIRIFMLTVLLHCGEKLSENVTSQLELKTRIREVNEAYMFLTKITTEEIK
ncbi:hypothetical protein L484_002527 [Morus notabilis]|uniref:Uncharacterized protein n=1 Tax=Morus notabilis TaxID=981085 RepID=W9S9R2_9ROSA|nr:hypothetical protein L484_002527 [Morus notabilis]